MTIVQPEPAITTRNIKLADGTVIPARTETTAQPSIGNNDLVLIFVAGRTHLVPYSAIRYL